MLTSFFGKSAPLNFVLLCAYIFVLFLAQLIINPEMDFSVTLLSVYSVIVLLLFFSVLLLDFTIRKNGLTKLNTYAIFMFACGAAMLNGIISDLWMVLGNVFVLLALRRIFSFQKPNNSERKIIDATIWVLLASGIYFWNILLLAPLYLAIALQSKREFRFYLIPLVAATGMFFITTAYYYVREDSFAWFMRWPDTISLYFTPYGNTQLLVFISFLLALIVWTLVPKINAISKGAKKEKPNYLVEIAALLAIILAVVFSSGKTGEELLFLIAPAVIIMTGYLENQSEMWFKEVLLWSFLLLPIFFLFLE